MASAGGPCPVGQGPRELQAASVTIDALLGGAPGALRPGCSALSRGTVVVEAVPRSGALNTARHARDQGRPLMAVPGPVTTALSVGCHEIIRDWAPSASPVPGT